MTAVDGARRPDGPVVAVLATHWGSGSEERWFTRQVAGALACVGDVHVITPQGDRAATHQDGLFTVHRLGTPLDAAAELRRDLIVEALGATGSGDRPVPRDAARLLDDGLIRPWDAADGVLRSLAPDLVVVVDHRNLGALAAIDRCASGTPMALIGLAAPDHVGSSPHFDPVVDRATGILTVTELERQEFVRRYGRPEAVHRVGAPMSANASVLTEPNTWVGDSDYVFVRTEVGSAEDEVEAELANLIRLRFDLCPVGIAFTDGFFVWHGGRLQRGWPIERSSDLARLMAWAKVTVDLHTGSLFGRPCVESLLFGTPIVVPEDSRSREHAQRGQGGLWFADPAELTWCIESLLETQAGDVLGQQGRAYAEREYGSTTAFIDRVTAACGLTGHLDPVARDPEPASV